MAIACRGFANTTRLVARAEGATGLRLVEYPPPNLGVQTAAEIRDYASAILDDVIGAMTRPAPGIAEESRQSAAADVVFKGDLQAVNEFFHAGACTDGLPVVPPTRAAVEAMLTFSDLPPEHVLGVLPPKRYAATVWKTAVNGVMAGCRPEYMPVLIALVEAIADPRFGLQHAGSTSGWSPIIILNGPIARELGFASGQGVLRPHAQANASVARFLRLCMVNLAGYKVGETDMASFGRAYLPVLAEAEAESPWQPLCADRGFPDGSNVVSVQSLSSMSHAFLTEGDGTNHLRYIAKEMSIFLGGATLQALGMFGEEMCPLVCLSPLVAKIVADAGYSKADAKQYLFDHARVPALELDERLRRRRPGVAAGPGEGIRNAIRGGILPACFDVGDDLSALVPVVHRPEEITLVVSGPADRNRNFIGSQLGEQGLIVSKPIRTPRRPTAGA